MRRRLRRRPAPWKALTPKSTIWKALGSLRLEGFTFSLIFRAEGGYRQGLGGWVRYTLPPLLQGHPPHPDAPLLLASLRRAPGWAP